MGVGRRVRRRPAPTPQGPESGGRAVGNAGSSRPAATLGGAEKRARRRKEAFAIETGRGAKKIAAGMRYATPQTTASARQAMPNRIEPLNTANAAVAYRRTMGRYSVAIVIWRKHHSVQAARSAPSNVGTSAAGTYAIFSPASRTACVRIRSSLNTSRHRSSSRSGTTRSFRIAQEPPHANERRGSNSTFALTAFHSARTRDQKVGRGGRYQRNPVATPTVESARGCTSCRNQSGAGRMSESANTTTSSSRPRWARADRKAFTFPRSGLGSERIVPTSTRGNSRAIDWIRRSAGSAESSATTRIRYRGYTWDNRPRTFSSNPTSSPRTGRITATDGRNAPRARRTARRTPPRSRIPWTMDATLARNVKTARSVSPIQRESSATDTSPGGGPHPFATQPNSANKTPEPRPPQEHLRSFMEGPLHGQAGLSMTREEHAKFLAQCKEFVLGMNRLEQTITKIDARLTKDEQRSAFKEIFEWLGTTTEVPPNSYTREWARELLAAIGAMAQYDKYEGSPDSYIL